LRVSASSIGLSNSRPSCRIVSISRRVARQSADAVVESIFSGEVGESSTMVLMRSALVDDGIRQGSVCSSRRAGQRFNERLVSRGHSTRSRRDQCRRARGVQGSGTLRGGNQPAASSSLRLLDWSATSPVQAAIPPSRLMSRLAS
ncbi:hypothetical protein, partial [Teichococcus globiformis]|uniref:hypothetical protein n=1 Tax=Teichococcus globiformis TaxID=2307229 RepID=UPI0036D2F1AB